MGEFGKGEKESFGAVWTGGIERQDCRKKGQ